MRSFILAFVLIGCSSSPATHPDSSSGGDAPHDSLGSGSAGADAGTDGTKNDGLYHAYGTNFGLERLRVAETTSTTCFEIDLITPGSDGMGVTVPSSWGVAGASAMQPPAACNPAYEGPITNMLTTSSQSGSIAWQGAGTPPSIDSVDVTLVFTDPPSWCPASETLNVTNLVVN